MCLTTITLEVIFGRMKAHHRKRKTRYEFELTGTGRATAHGGQVLVDALCRRFRLWERLAAVPVGAHAAGQRGQGLQPGVEGGGEET